MPLRPFPLDLGIGTDICHLPRIKALITTRRSDFHRPLQRFLHRLFNEREQKAFWGKYGNVANALGPNINDVVRHLGGR